MVRSQISLRLSNRKVTGLKSMASSMGTTYSNLIRDKIDEILVNDISPETKERALKITTELRAPFVFVKNIKGTARAQKEKAIREEIAQKIEKVFGLT